MAEYTAELETMFSETLAARVVLDEIATKWSVMILSVICTKPSRFNAIKRRLPGITHKALAEALRRLQRSGLITRHVVNATPVAVEYAMTPLGLTLRDPFIAIYSWAAAHASEMRAAQRQYDQDNPT